MTFDVFQRRNFLNAFGTDILTLNDNRYGRGLCPFQPLRRLYGIADPVMPAEQDGALEDADGHLPDFSVGVRTQLVPE